MWRRKEDGKRGHQREDEEEPAAESVNDERSELPVIALLLKLLVGLDLVGEEAQLLEDLPHLAVRRTHIGKRIIYLCGVVRLTMIVVSAEVVVGTAAVADAEIIVQIEDVSEQTF